MDQPLAWLSPRAREATLYIPSRSLVLHNLILWSISRTSNFQLLRLLHRAQCTRNSRLLRKSHATSNESPRNINIDSQKKKGASAVLVFGAIESPLAQPRALIFGHFFSALIGICITKLFSLMPDQTRFESLRWLAASLSTAIAIVVMQLTGTTHPPAGATALLPATSQEIWRLSWYFLPVVLLSSVMLMVCALLFNNLHRRYPAFWIAPAPPKPVAPPAPVPVSVDVSLEGEKAVKSPV